MRHPCDLGLGMVVDLHGSILDVITKVVRILHGLEGRLVIFCQLFLTVAEHVPRLERLLLRQHLASAASIGLAAVLNHLTLQGFLATSG